MVKLHPPTQGVLVYGTDGEKALAKGFGRPLPFTLNLMCDLHMKDNSTSKLSELGINSTVADGCQADIFGKSIGSSRQLGLIDALSPQEFESKLESLSEVWKCRHARGERFSVYFIKYKAEMITRTMMADIRSMAGLGFTTTVYNQYGNNNSIEFATSSSLLEGGAT